MKFITKIKNILCLLTANILMLLPQFVLADTPSGGPLDVSNPASAWATLFQPLKNDVSIHFLRQIFGNIPGSGLTSGSTSILSEIFYVFNCGIFGLAALFLSYVVVVTIYDVAHNPEQMKGKANWMQIIRIPMSVGLMVPLGTTGYSSLNAVIMWTVLQSVGLADHVWTIIVDYIYRGGVLYNTTAVNQQHANNIEADLLNKDGDKNAGTSDVLRSQICMRALQVILEDARISRENAAKQSQAIANATATDTTVQNFSTSDTSTVQVDLKSKYSNGDLDPDTKQPVYAAIFPFVTDDDLKNWGLNDIFKPTDLNGVCGAYSWQNVPPMPSACNNTTTKQVCVAWNRTKMGVDEGCLEYKTEVVSSTDNGQCDREGPDYYRESKGVGMSNLMNDFGSMGKLIFDNYGSCVSAGCHNKAEIDSFINTNGPQSLAMSTSTYQATIYSARTLAGNNPDTYYMVDKTGDYQSGNELGQGIGLKQSREALKATLDSGGWVLAGKYYFDLIHSANTFLNPLEDSYKKLVFTQVAPTMDQNGQSNPAFKAIAGDDNSIYSKLKASIKNFDDKSFPLVFGNSLALVNPIDDNAVNLIGTLNTNMSDTDKLINDNTSEFTSDINPSLKSFQSNISWSPLKDFTGGRELIVGTQNFEHTSYLVDPVRGLSTNEIIFTPLNKALNKVICNWKSSLNVGGDTKFDPTSTPTTCNIEIAATDAPIVKVAKLGEIMLQAAFEFWNTFLDQINTIMNTIFGIAVGLTTTSGVAAPFSFLGIGLGVSSFVNSAATLINLFVKLFVEVPISVGLPIAMAVTGLMFTTGATMAFYIPMIPFMLFTFGVISWLSLVIESMAAAPLVALGMAHPGGQEFLGNKGEQAVMLLFGIFLRPISMLIGLVAALVLSYVSIDVLNIGFGHLVSSSSAMLALSHNQGSIEQLRNGAMILVYVFVVMALINQCFSLIHVVPAMLGRWIGVPQMPDQSEKLLGEVQAGVKEFGGAISKGITEGGSAATKYIQNAGREVKFEGKKGESKGQPTKVTQEPSDANKPKSP